MSYRMNGRFAPTAPSQDYSFVTIQNPACKPAKVMHSEHGGGTVYINAMPIIGRDGKPNSKEMISYRAANKQDLKVAIEKNHQASFSSTGTEVITDVKTMSSESAKSVLKSIREDARPVTEDEKQHAYNRLVRAYGAGSEITLEKCLAQGIREQVFNELHKQEQQKFVGMVLTEHRKIAAEMSEQERRSHTAMNVDDFMQEGEWATYFKQYEGNFMSYPDRTFKNFDVLFKFCELKGWEVPVNYELDLAFRYLLAHSHLYLLPTYPRTKRDAYRQVRELTHIEPDVVPTDEHKQAIANTKGLTARQLRESLASMRSRQPLTERELRDRARRTY